MTTKCKRGWIRMRHHWYFTYQRAQNELNNCSKQAHIVPNDASHLETVRNPFPSFFGNLCLSLLLSPDSISKLGSSLTACGSVVKDTTITYSWTDPALWCFIKSFVLWCNYPLRSSNCLLEECSNCSRNYHCPSVTTLHFNTVPYLAVPLHPTPPPPHRHTCLFGSSNCPVVNHSLHVCVDLTERQADPQVLIRT